ncbi:MAG TPA: gamma-glutamylcyclotransferase [Paenibacillus sp.]|nr:gamma-glutamylcyclotransferase [Paenibacillus sp.]
MALRGAAWYDGGMMDTGELRMRREDDGVTLVFVYGTLLRGEANHRRLRDAKARAATAVVEGGTLYDTGRGYPAMMLEPRPGDGNATVRGEVYEVDEATLRSLDELEDYYGPNDPRNEYERVRIEVVTEDGSLEAWTYVYKRAPAGSERIPHGDWRGRRK